MASYFICHFYLAVQSNHKREWIECHGVRATTDAFTARHNVATTVIGRNLLEGRLDRVAACQFDRCMRLHIVPRLCDTRG